MIDEKEEGMKETPQQATLRGRFAGALLGTLVGDVIGAPMEGWDQRRLNDTLDLLERLPRHSPYRTLCDHRVGVLGGRLAPGMAYYTDDTQMTFAVADSLVRRGGFDGKDMAGSLADRFEGKRSYGPGIYSVLTSLRRGVPWESAGHHLFGGEGSLGNGGAVRVAPVSLLYHAGDPDLLWQIAERSAAITHTHPLGRAGAALQAVAISVAIRWGWDKPFDAFRFLNLVRETMPGGVDRVYVTALDAVEQLLRRHMGGVSPTREEIVKVLGSGVEAHRSVPTALYIFLTNPESFEATVRAAVRLGGDTDTIGAMCGALAGAFHGEAALPPPWLLAAENGAEGRDSLRGLALSLYDLWTRSAR